MKRYKYVGKERDEETGLYYYGARYYSAWLGRFVSVDPHAFKYPSWSSFVYVFNNPLIYTDPTGKDGDLKNGTTLIFQGDKNDKEFIKNSINFLDNIQDVWGDKLGQDLSNVKIKFIDSDEKIKLKRGENLVTFTDKGVSNVSGKRKNIVHINVNEMGKNTAAHEFGHVLGLADRYDEIVSIRSKFQEALSEGKNKIERLPSIPLSSKYFPKEKDYEKEKNLMSTSFPKLTGKQLKIANSPRVEKSKSSFYIFPNKYDKHGKKEYRAKIKNGKYVNIGKSIYPFLRGDNTFSKEILNLLKSMYNGKDNN